MFTNYTEAFCFTISRVFCSWVTSECLQVHASAVSLLLVELRDGDTTSLVLLKPLPNLFTQSEWLRHKLQPVIFMWCCLGYHSVCLDQNRQMGRQWQGRLAKTENKLRWWVWRPPSPIRLFFTMSLSFYTGKMKDNTLGLIESRRERHHTWEK